MVMRCSRLSDLLLPFPSCEPASPPSALLSGRTKMRVQDGWLTQTRGPSSLPQELEEAMGRRSCSRPSQTSTDKMSATPRACGCCQDPKSHPSKRDGQTKAGGTNSAVWVTGRGMPAELRGRAPRRSGCPGHETLPRARGSSQQHLPPAAAAQVGAVCLGRPCSWRRTLPETLYAHGERRAWWHLLRPETSAGALRHTAEKEGHRLQPQHGEAPTGESSGEARHREGGLGMGEEEEGRVRGKAEEKRVSKTLRRERLRAAPSPNLLQPAASQEQPDKPEQP